LSRPSTTSVPNGGSQIFATTHWTQVLEARGDSQASRAALSELCAAYYGPVFAFIRRNSRDEDAARDLTQEFFARLLARQSLDTADPQRGRFRSFLLGAVKHFLSDMRDRANRQKRGAGQKVESIDPGTDTSPGLQVCDPNALAPDLEFDRKWALTVLERSLNSLSREQQETGKAVPFEALKPWLTGDSETISQAEVSRQLGMNEGTVKVAIHRLRRRFREVIKREISQTIMDQSKVEEEMQCLLQALL
jgi:RNA polymerase sigma-70 factor (ECF subfamily)